MSGLQELPEYEWDEIKKHNNKSSLWIVVHDCIYDVTSFQEEHPGGEEVLIEQGGQDASSSFEDVGHSPEARALSDQYRIGTVAGGHPKLPKDIAVSTPPEKTSTPKSMIPCGIIAVSAGIGIMLIGAFLYYRYGRK